MFKLVFRVNFGDSSTNLSNHRNDVTADQKSSDRAANLNETMDRAGNCNCGSSREESRGAEM